jgi:DNA-directed RNA polymerase II subunit RPB1
MSLYKELSYDNDIETVKGIQFCIMSPEEIIARSVAEVLTTDTFCGTEAQKNGLFDPRMGVIDNNKVCGTCEQKNTFCPGHFGHITLAKPVFYIQFFEYVRRLLKCVCYRCSKLLIDIDSPEMKAILSKKHSRQKRFDLIYKLCAKPAKGKKCEHNDGCGAKCPDKISKDGIVRIVMEWKEIANAELKKQIFTAEDVLRIFKRISDADAEILGFHRKYNRPEWMICTHLPVPPPAVRPSVRNDTGQRMEDDLTHKLCDIVKANNQVKQKIDKKATKEQLDTYVGLLQYHVATLIDNQIPGIGPSMQRTGRPLRSLFERLKSKEGRIRGNLMGKRVDFSARTVITPDPNISIDEIGVPIKIAMNLTFPEVVNKYNKEELTKLVRNGPDTYPGAKYIRKQNPLRTIRLKNIDTSGIVLEDGDVVDRHLRNGDYVLFNRQPSLHKMSMQGHRVRVMPYDTFRLNACVCKSFNADKVNVRNSRTEKVTTC